MKPKLLLIHISFLFLFVSGIRSGYCRDIYVDPTFGNNISGDGSINNPYKTLKKSGEVAVGGDFILIKGEYHSGFKDTFIRINNGNTQMITIMPQNNLNVILDGTGANFIASWEAILTITNSKYVEVKNIEVMNNDSSSGIRVVSDSFETRFVNIRNCKTSNTRTQGILIQASDVIVDNCEINNACLINKNQRLGFSGWPPALTTYVDLSHPTMDLCRNIVFSNNIVSNSWGEGIAFIRTKGYEASNNIVRDCFSAYIYSDNSRNGVIRNNWVYSTSDTFNIQYENGIRTPAVGIYWAAEGNDYMLDSIVENIEIYNNLIVRTGPAFGWFDDTRNLYPNDSYRNIHIYYNTVFNTLGYQSFYIDDSNINPNRIPPSGCKFINNIICKAKYPFIINPVYNSYFTNSSDYETSWEIRNNSFIHGFPLGNYNLNNIQGNPLFLDSNNIINSSSNYKILSNSNCINAGETIFGINADYFNYPRPATPTIGFYEYDPFTGINMDPSNQALRSFSLNQNYPNPFNPSTTIEFNIPVRSFISLSIYDITGKKVEEIVNEYLNAGSYNYFFNAGEQSS